MQCCRRAPRCEMDARARTRQLHACLPGRLFRSRTISFSPTQYFDFLLSLHCIMDVPDVHHLKSGEVNLGVSVLHACPATLAHASDNVDLDHGCPVPGRRRHRRRLAYNDRQLHRTSAHKLQALHKRAHAYPQANRVTDKLTHVHDRIYCCRSGSAADTQASCMAIVCFYSNDGMFAGRSRHCPLLPPNVRVRTLHQVPITE